MGGASKREILSIKPEILFLRAVSETSLKAFLTHSLASGVKGRTLVEGCQAAHSSLPRKPPAMSLRQARWLFPEVCLFTGTLDERNDSLRSGLDPPAIVTNVSVQLEVAARSALVSVLLGKSPIC